MYAARRSLVSVLRAGDAEEQQRGEIQGRWQPQGTRIAVCNPFTASGARSSLPCTPVKATVHQGKEKSTKKATIGPIDKPGDNRRCAGARCATLRDLCARSLLQVTSYRHAPPLADFPFQLRRAGGCSCFTQAVQRGLRGDKRPHSDNESIEKVVGEVLAAAHRGFLGLVEGLT
jgi:hypothetical protein